MMQNTDSPRQMFRVWRGLGLWNWIRLLALRPALDRSSFSPVASLTLTSALNSLLHLVEHLVWGRRINRVELNPSPIFILGHWRSGTTLLHQLLALDPQFGHLNLYQTLFPGHFLLTERWATRMTAQLLPAVRPMDNMPLAWDLPQEDETAMLLLTLYSPYISAAFPHEPQRFARFGSLQSGLTEREMRNWKRAFLRLLRKAALRHENRPLILKSPTHTSRIPLLLQLFPRARFIYLIRDPYMVYASTLRLWRSMYEMNRLSRMEAVNLEEQVLEGYMKMYQAYHLHRALFEESQFHELRYEELIHDPVAGVETAYRKLKIPGFDQALPKIEMRLSEHREYRTSTPPLTREEMTRVYERWQPAFRRYGYPSRL